MLIAGPAAGQTVDGRAWRLEVAAGLGYAAPFGRYEAAPPTGNATLSQDISGSVPIALRVGARRRDKLLLGLGAEYAFVAATAVPCATEPCPGQQDGSSIRAAVDAEYAFRPGAKFRPWIGVGAGLEWLTSTVTSYRNAPFVELDVGGTAAPTPQTRVGPFLGVSVGQFVHANYFGPRALLGSSFDTGGMLGTPAPIDRDRDISARAWHGWIQIGLRGAFSSL
jgi:hypothetical protein